MDQKPNLEVVVLAVSTLYKNPDRKEKERASQWLLNLQNSVFAWTVADELLHKKPDLESCYFAAQTMRTKIHQSFHELPLEVHSSLRDSLLEHLSQITEETNRIITTQLCLALADLILQMPAWQGAPLDLINKFSSHSYIWPLIEVLTVLPEELESRSVRLGENRRQEVLEDLKRCSSTVIEFLTHCCNTYGSNLNENTHILTRTLRCFTSWVSVEAIGLQNLSNSVIVNLAFQILDFNPHEGKQSTGALCDSATECICTLLRSLENNNNLVDLENYLFNNIVQLEPSYHYSVANEDQSRSIDYCRLFTELSETFLDKIVTCSGPNNMHYSAKALDLVLLCVGHHDYEVAEITFNLWPHIERLITALCRHCQMEPDTEGLLENGDEFKDFRMKVSEIIRDVAFIVGSTSCFCQMYLNLENQSPTWDQTEAALFVMMAVAKYVLTSENDVVPKVIEGILNMPDTTHIAVRHTSLMLLGELCEWMEEHPSTLIPVLNFIIRSLEQPGLGFAAASALQNICSTCSGSLCGHVVPVLMQLLHQVDSFSITEEVVVGLFKAVSAIVAAMPHSQITAPMRELCMIQANGLCQLLDQNQSITRGTKTDPVLWLDRLSSILRHMIINNVREDEIHPCKAVILETWPVLSRVFDRYQNDIRIMERCCRSVRFMLRCASSQILEILENLVSQIVRIYSVHKHSCFLYVGSILVDEYASNPQCVNGLIDMLQMFLEPTFQLLQGDDGLRNHPETVDDFFRLCGRFTRRASKAFLTCSALGPILQCALMASQLEHKEANVSVMKFFCDLISQGVTGQLQPDFRERVKLVQGILNQFGQQLVTTLIQSCVFYLQTYLLPDVADVFIQLLEFNRDTTTKWVMNGLDTLPKRNNGSTMAATPEQLSDIHLKIVRANSSRTVSFALKELIRYYR
ncbi:hypothetical protein GWI33_021499 [Rhynchophorus ferrugineus]|uniref:Importin N-terminal domain-containing protein n=1 Tax=Rhynchophorus ferrugineus TaxID=354439 RepID=A0A834IRU2_RHYFE|nr:hypothetical protein GWI33_021499 [Rhynchophorus ferrugineus]